MHRFESCELLEDWISTIQFSNVGNSNSNMSSSATSSSSASSSSGSQIYEVSNRSDLQQQQQELQQKQQSQSSSESSSSSWGIIIKPSSQSVAEQLVEALVRLFQTGMRPQLRGVLEVIKTLDRLPDHILVPVPADSFSNAQLNAPSRWYRSPEDLQEAIEKSDATAAYLSTCEIVSLPMKSFKSALFVVNSAASNEGTTNCKTPGSQARMFLRLCLQQRNLLAVVELLVAMIKANDGSIAEFLFFHRAATPLLDDAAFPVTFEFLRKFGGPPLVVRAAAQQSQLSIGPLLESPWDPETCSGVTQNPIIASWTIWYAQKGLRLKWDLEYNLPSDLSFPDYVREEEEEEDQKGFLSGGKGGGKKTERSNEDDLTTNIEDDRSSHVSGSHISSGLTGGGGGGGGTRRKIIIVKKKKKGGVTVPGSSRVVSVSSSRTPNSNDNNNTNSPVDENSSSSSSHRRSPGLSSSAAATTTTTITPASLSSNSHSHSQNNNNSHSYASPPLAPVYHHHNNNSNNNTNNHSTSATSLTGDSPTRGGGGGGVMNSTRSNSQLNVNINSSSRSGRRGSSSDEMKGGGSGQVEGEEDQMHQQKLEGELESSHNEADEYEEQTKAEVSFASETVSRWKSESEKFTNSVSEEQIQPLLEIYAQLVYAKWASGLAKTQIAELRLMECCDRDANMALTQQYAQIARERSMTNLAAAAAQQQQQQQQQKSVTAAVSASSSSSSISPPNPSKQLYGQKDDLDW